MLFLEITDRELIENRGAPQPEKAAAGGLGAAEQGVREARLGAARRFVNHGSSVLREHEILAEALNSDRWISTG
jgi:hypothetical protein